MLAGGELAAVSGPGPPEAPRRGRLRRQLTATVSGLFLTVLLVLLGLALLGALLAGLAFLAFAMPLTTGAVLAVLLIGGIAAWRANTKRH